MPGSVVRAGDLDCDATTWVSRSCLELTLPPTLAAGPTELTVTKPRWCLHPHVARLAITVAAK
jgi:hypothetical protein